MAYCQLPLEPSGCLLSSSAPLRLRGENAAALRALFDSYRLLHYS